MYNLNLLSYFAVTRNHAFQVYGYHIKGREIWEGRVDVVNVQGGNCYRLPYSGQTGAFTRGRTVTDGTATAYIVHFETGPANTGTLYLANVSGTFTHGAPLSDGASGAAVANIPAGILGEEQAVFDFSNYFGGPDTADSGSNNIVFSLDTEIEGSIFECLYFGPGSGPNYFAGKIHGRLAGGSLVPYPYPAVRIDGGTGNRIMHRTQIYWPANIASVRIENTGYVPSNNVLEGASLSGGVDIIGDCQRNSVLDCRGSPQEGVRPGFVHITNGSGNRVRGSILLTNVPEVSDEARLFARLAVDRIEHALRLGQVPPSGFPATSVPLSAYRSGASTLLHLQAGVFGAGLTMQDISTTGVARFMVKGDDFVHQFNGSDLLTLESYGRMSLNAPGQGMRLRAPGGGYHTLTVSDAGKLLINGTVVGTQS
ncbi:hypothetical protein ACXN5S_05775 [Pseudoroseicyclus sp. H15]